MSANKTWGTDYQDLCLSVLRLTDRRLVDLSERIQKELYLRANAKEAKAARVTPPVDPT